jgi:CMP-N-acetylneuraminic acid synthetase
MSQTLALIPAKRHSEGRPGKNFDPILNGLSCVDLAISIGRATCDRVCLTSDALTEGLAPWDFDYGLRRPDALCQPTTPMIDVVRHALEQVPGPPDEIIVLLQPTSPLRTAETVRQAIDEARGVSIGSIVSVTLTYPAEWVLTPNKYGSLVTATGSHPDRMPSRRQDCRPSYRRDGVAYAFPRRNITMSGSIYGWSVRPLYTPPAEALSIDTPEDWDEAVRRLARAETASADRR